MRRFMTSMRWTASVCCIWLMPAGRFSLCGSTRPAGISTLTGLPWPVVRRGRCRPSTSVAPGSGQIRSRAIRVERISTRVRCVGAFRSQPTIDPQRMQQWVPGVKWGAPALGCSFEESLRRREEFLPLIATSDGRVYFVSTGKSYVIQAGPKFEIVGGGDLGGWGNGSSPAVSNGRIFVRDFDFLWCLGNQ